MQTAQDAARSPDRGLAKYPLSKVLYARQVRAHSRQCHSTAKSPDRGTVRRSRGGLRPLFRAGEIQS